MTPSHGELLQHSNLVNAQAASNMEEVNKRPIEKATMPEALTEVALVDPNEDPFGGNTNNRRVAKRIANEKKRVYLNHSNPTHSGDPDKARRDIAKSEALNPDVDASLEVEPAILPGSTLKPNADSPAAKRAAKEAEAKGKAVPAVDPAVAAGSTGASPVPPWGPQS